MNRPMFSFRPALFAAGLAAMIGFSVTFPAVAGTDDPIAAILAAHRRAMGKIPDATVTLTYDYSADGLTGVARSVWDSRSGHYADFYQAGPSRGGRGYDGHTPWQQDLSGSFTPELGGDRLELAINAAYRAANLWWHADRGGATIVYVGRDADGDHLQVTPHGGKIFDAWFDKTTHFLVRLHEMRGFQSVDEKFSQFEKHESLVVAAKHTVESGTAEIYRLTAANIDASRSQEAFGLAALPTDSFIQGGATEVTLPFRLLNNHIFVDARIDDGPALPFLVDTGGHNIVTPSTLLAQGLHDVGASASSGAGEKSVSSGYVKLREIAVGNVKLRDQTALSLDFSPKAVEGFQVGGMLGFELFRRFAVRIDYGTQQLTIIDPAHFDAADAGTAVPFHFYDHMPEVEGRFADIAARFTIDTGSRVEVTMASPSVEAHHLRALFGQGITAVDGWGVGGPTPSYVTRVPSLSLGDVTVAAPVASFSAQKHGYFSDTNYDGNIGSGLLKRFVVTFDYAHSTMYLKPLATPPVDVGSFDRSGMWVNLGAAGFEIMNLATDGPAMQAGLAVGDEILSIGTQEAAQLTLSDARKVFRTLPVGEDIEIRVRRDGKTQIAHLRPRDLIPPARL